MFLATLVFECECGIQFGFAQNSKTGQVGPGLGVRVCEVHKPSQLALEPEPWNPAGLIVKSFQVDQVTPQPQSTIARPEVAQVVGDFERKLKT
jgi:hypothetical protein